MPASLQIFPSCLQCPQALAAVSWGQLCAHSPTPTRVLWDPSAGQGRAGQGAEPAPSWHPALGSTTSLIRCLIFKMLTDFTALSWPRARCGPRWRLLPELGVPEPAPPWVARPWPRAHPPVPGVFLQPFLGHPHGSPGDSFSLLPAPGAAPSL